MRQTYMDHTSPTPKIGFILMGHYTAKYSGLDAEQVIEQKGDDGQMTGAIQGLVAIIGTQRILSNSRTHLVINHAPVATKIYRYEWFQLRSSQSRVRNAPCFPGGLPTSKEQQPLNTPSPDTSALQERRGDRLLRIKNFYG